MRKHPSSRILAANGLLNQLLDADTASRERQLAEIRARDTSLALILGRLLSLCEDGSGTLQPGGALQGDLARECLLGGDTRKALAPGATIGPYRIEALIGRGGMAEVYRATRQFDGFSQPVALKLMRSDRIDAGLRERLLAEQRTLVRLDHPDIARFLDAGIGEGGDAYLAMELVDGTSITDHATATRADLRTRVRWMVALCDALMHAHALLVVHCDIKPSNVLVDAQGRLRLLDFGIACLMDGAPDADDDGVKLFTPDYAAPEQVGDGAVTTATDVYQVGALLYRLVAGRPWRPREGVPAGAGALDAVMAKCLAHAPADRYASIERLRADLCAWLEDRPLAAAPAGLGTRARLWLRRNRRPVGVAAAGLACLALVSAVSLARLAEERAAKAREQERAVAVEAFMGQVFEQASPFMREDRENALETLVRVGDAQLAAAADMDPRTRLHLLAVLARLEIDQGQPGRAEARARRALARSSADGVARTDAALDMQRLLATALDMQDRSGEAMDAMRGAEALASELALPAGEMAALQVQLGDLHASNGDQAQAAQAFDAAFDTLVSDATPLDRGVLRALRRVATYLEIGQRPEDLARMKAIVRRLSPVPAQGETAIERAARLSVLGFVESLAGDPGAGGTRGSEAAQVHAAVLGATHRQVAGAWGDACVSFINGGAVDRARDACANALAAAMDGGRGESSEATGYRLNLATIDFLRGDLAAAGALAASAMPGLDTAAEPFGHYFVLGLLARVDFRQGRTEAALARFDEMLGIQRESFPESVDLMAEVQISRAEILVQLGRLDEARAALEESERKDATGGLRDRLLPARLVARATLAAATGRRAEARAFAGQALQDFAAHPAVSDSEMAWALLDAGEALLRAGERDAAARAFRDALGKGLSPDGTPGLWAWATLRDEQLRPGRHAADRLARAVRIGREQFGTGTAGSVPCLRVPGVSAPARPACL